MKKRVITILIFITSIFMFACKKEENKKIEIILDSTTIAAGDEVYMTINSSKIGSYVYESSDETIAKVDEFGFLKAIKPGNVTIKVYLEADPTIYGEININITDMVLTNIKITGNTMGHVGDTLDINYIQYPRGVKAELNFKSSDESIASVDANGDVTLKKEGISTITITSGDNYTQSFNVGAFDFSSIVVDSEKNAIDGEKIIYNGKEYYYNYTYISSLKDACKYIDENGTIYVLSGTYTDDAIISKNGAKIYGVNKDINPNSNNAINNESVIENVIVINDGLNDIEIKGLTFTDQGYINIYGNNKNLTIMNNIFINSSISAEWSKISSQGLIYFKNNTNSSDNVIISQNKFKNISCNCIIISYILNLKILNNTFEDFKLDAIRTNLTEALNSCQWLIRGNTFKDGNYNGIYFASFGSKVVSHEQIISIFDNNFTNIGTNNGNIYNNAYGAISMTTFNGGTTSICIRYNNFDNCLSLVRIDNEQDETYFNNLTISANYNMIKMGDATNYLFTSFKQIGSNSSETIENENYINCKNNVYLNSSNLDALNDAQMICSNSDVSNNITKAQYDALTHVYANPTLHLTLSSKIISEEENITYKASNDKILTVDKDGNITPVAIGSASIEVLDKNGALVGTFDFDVKDTINIDYASLIVKIALNEEGYVEGYNNYTKYGVWYASLVADKSFENGAWCAMFVSWCANQANIPTSIIPLYAAVSSGRQWFESRGLFQYKENYTPKTGDLIFFLSNGASHTGIVVDYKDGKVYTIEGNTSNMCAQRSYDPQNARITGYGTPNYPVYNGTKIDFDISGATDGDGHSTK